MISDTLTVKNKKLCTLIVKIPTLLQQSFVFSVGGAKVFFLQKKKCPKLVQNIHSSGNTGSNIAKQY